MANSDSARSFIPEVYEDVVRQIMPFYDTMQSEIIDLVRTVKPDVTQWLDTGCGTGTLVETALRFFPDTAFVLADPTELMLKAAAARLKDTPQRKEATKRMNLQQILNRRYIPNQKELQRNFFIWGTCSWKTGMGFQLKLKQP